MVSVLLAVAGALFVALQLGCCAQRESVLEDRAAVSKCSGVSPAGEQSQCGAEMAGADSETTVGDAERLTEGIGLDAR